MINAGADIERRNAAESPRRETLRRRNNSSNWLHDLIYGEGTYVPEHKNRVKASSGTDRSGSGGRNKTQRRKKGDKYTER
jgi:hypothetical protein